MPSHAGAIAYHEATVEEAEAIATLHADSWRRIYRGTYADSFLDGDVVSDRRKVWAERLAANAPDRRTFIAENDGRVVGFAHVVLGRRPFPGERCSTTSTSRTIAWP